MSILFVTGASSGIGKCLVERALQRGDRVFATARSKNDLQAFASEKFFTGIVMDVGDNASVSQGFEQLDTELSGQKLDAVVNCAGVAPFGAVELIDFSQYELANNTNFLGSVRIARAALPRLRGHGGRLIFVTSLWGIVSGPMLSAYTTSKFAIEAFADSLRRETRSMDVHIILAQPGVVHTRMLTDQVAETRAYADRLDGQAELLYGEAYRAYADVVASGAKTGISTEKAAQSIERCLFAKKPRHRYRIGIDAKLMWLLSRLLPSTWLDVLFGAMLKGGSQK